jgi:hypothetical protein
MDHLKKWWATHVTWVSLAVAFLDPSVQAWISKHPAETASVGAIWAVMLHLLPSPVQNKP